MSSSSLPSAESAVGEKLAKGERERDELGGGESNASAESIFEPKYGKQLTENDVFTIITKF